MNDDSTIEHRSCEMGAISAAVNRNESPLLSAAIEIVCEQDFISMHALNRMLASRFPEQSETTSSGRFVLSQDSTCELKAALEAESSSPDARVGVTKGCANPETEPHMADEIVYSAEWMKQMRGQMRKGAPQLSDRRIIGVGLYKKIVDNGWDWDNAGGRPGLCYGKLQLENYDKLMAANPNSPNEAPNWALFRARAGRDSLAFPGAQQAQGLIKDIEFFEAENGGEEHNGVFYVFVSDEGGCGEKPTGTEVCGESISAIDARHWSSSYIRAAVRRDAKPNGNGFFPVVFFICSNIAQLNWEIVEVKTEEDKKRFDGFFYDPVSGLVNREEELQRWWRMRKTDNLPDGGATRLLRKVFGGK